MKYMNENIEAYKKEVINELTSGEKSRTNFETPGPFRFTDV